MKKILIISPNSWGKLHISKHNYAIELAKSGNLVYFLNTPNNIHKKSYDINEIENHPNLFLINYKLFTNKIVDYVRFRFGITFFIDKSAQKIIKKICKKEKIIFDEVWNFDPNLHGFFDTYTSGKKIFFIADQIQLNSHLRAAKNADVVVSVAKEILEKYKPINNNCLLINHGLNYVYEKYAHQKINLLSNQNKEIKNSEKLNIGYIGNLLTSSLYFNGLKKIILENPKNHFHFWGAYELLENNLMDDYDSEIYNTIQWIKNNTVNTSFYGVKTGTEIISNLEKIDLFIYINDSKKDINGGANSHKILEYLSTGKVIVSTYLSYYSNRNLFPMLNYGQESDYSLFLKEVVDNIGFYNSYEKQNERIKFALDNTYSKNIQKIYKLN